MSPEREKQFAAARQRKAHNVKKCDRQLGIGPCEICDRDKPQQHLLSKDGKTKYVISRNFPEDR